MTRQPTVEQTGLSRRYFLQGVGGSGLLSVGLTGAAQPRSVQAAPSQSGGVARMRARDPLGWDPMRTTTFRTHVAVSFTHNRLFRYQAGPEVPIGRMILEPDLVERWEQPSDTRYIFHLRRGVRWHNKSPVNGRELVAEDVRYSIERFLTVKGNANRPLLADMADVKVLGTHTVQVDLHSRNVWFLDYLAEASTLPIIAKEVIDKFGSMKRPEAVVGTGPWMLASYTPNVEAVFQKNPTYFRQGLPYLDEVRLIMIDDGATASAAYMSGQLDFGWSIYHTIRGREYRIFREKHPDWHYQGFRPNVHAFIAMRSDRPPFDDQRVRQAISMAINRAPRPSKWRRLDTAVPASFKDWHLPVDQLGDGAQYYQYNPDASRRLLQQAGLAQGFTTSMLVHTGYSPLWADYIERVVGWLGEVGIKVQQVPKEYGAYIRLLSRRKYDGMVMALNKPFVIPDGFVYWRYLPDNSRNLSYVNDAEMTELVQAQHREPDVTQRRAIFDEISRRAAVNQYYIHLSSWPRIASWQPYVMNYNTNLGYDYGGRLEAAWFARF